jgi:exodeoxyribonuclease-1
LSAQELREKIYATWNERQEDNFLKIHVKELHLNKVPAVAPLGVLGQANGWEKVQLDLEMIEKHKAALLAAPHFAENIRTAFEAKPEFERSRDPEAQLYDGFVGDRDRLRVETVRNATERELADFHPEFSDERLGALLHHYKARNYPGSLSEDEARRWEAWRAQHITAQLPRFVKSLQKLAAAESDENKQFVLQELQLWAESIVPVEGVDQSDES